VLSWEGGCVLQPLRAVHTIIGHRPGSDAVSLAEGVREMSRLNEYGFLGLQRRLCAVVAVGAMAIAFDAAAMTVTLSNVSNDSGVDAADLSATMDFEVDGNTLTLSASNDSDDFDITAFYFNVAASVTALTLTSGPGNWKLADQLKGGDPIDTGVFGVFDYVVWVTGKKADTGKLESGDVATFVFEIGGVGPFDATDFASEISLVDAGEIPVFTAARFRAGDESAIGAAHAPEPTTGLLFGMGMCFMSAYSSRRRSRARS
jgi:hypothetical protein